MPECLRRGEGLPLTNHTVTRLPLPLTQQPGEQRDSLCNTTLLHVYQNRLQKLVIGLLLSGLSWMSCAVTAAIKLCTESSRQAVGLQGDMSEPFSGGGEE